MYRNCSYKDLIRIVKQIERFYIISFKIGFNQLFIKTFLYFFCIKRENKKIIEILNIIPVIYLYC